MDTLPVCRDFKVGKCKRPQCKYVHLQNENVEIQNGNVTVCKEALQWSCAKLTCKYYHIPQDIHDMQITKFQMRQQLQLLKNKLHFI